MLESQLYHRCGARVESGTGSDVVVELVIGSGGTEDGYIIGGNPGGGVLITGNPRTPDLSLQPGESAAYAVDD